MSYGCFKVEFIGPRTKVLTPDSYIKEGPATGPSVMILSVPPK